MDCLEDMNENENINVNEKNSKYVSPLMVKRQKRIHIVIYVF